MRALTAMCRVAIDQNEKSVSDYRAAREGH
jgi:hypothetical protein